MQVRKEEGSLKEAEEPWGVLGIRHVLVVAMTAAVMSVIVSIAGWVGIEHGLLRHWFL